MSFKRDGDDKHALNNLRRRRVSDLLYEDIQEGEVSKLRNGRYLCKVCGHCPTFDTLNMFQVHKQGRKHQTSLEYQEAKRQELQDLIQKRQHQLEEDPNVPSNTQILGQAVARPSTKPKPYDPRSRNHRAKPYDRKATIDLQDCTGTYSSTNTEATSLDMLPGTKLNGNGNNYSDNQSLDLKVNQSDKGCQIIVRPHKLTNTCNTKSTRKSHFPGNMKPDLKDQDNILRSNNIPQLVGLGKPGDVSKHYFARKQKIQTSKDTIEPVIKPKSVQDFTKSWDYFKDKSIAKASIPAKKVVEKKAYETGALHKVSAVKPGASCHKYQHESGGAGTQLQATDVQLGTNRPEGKERAAKMLNAFGSGWKKDWAGNWVKDEDAEFDSDDELPDVT